jgi:hypothetical protein
VSKKKHMVHAELLGPKMLMKRIREQISENETAVARCGYMSLPKSNA